MNDFVLAPISTPSTGIQEAIDIWVEANLSGIDVIAPAIQYVGDDDFISAVNNVLSLSPGNLVGIVCVSSNLTTGILDRLQRIATNRRVSLFQI